MISGNVYPVASLYGIFNTVNTEYALSVIDNYPMRPRMCMRLLFACAGFKIETSHYIIGPEMKRSEYYFFRSIFDKVTGCFG